MIFIYSWVRLNQQNWALKLFGLLYHKVTYYDLGEERLRGILPDILVSGTFLALSSFFKYQYLLCCMTGPVAVNLYKSSGTWEANFLFCCYSNPIFVKLTIDRCPMKLLSIYWNLNSDLPWSDSNWWTQILGSLPVRSFQDLISSKQYKVELLYCMILWQYCHLT